MVCQSDNPAKPSYFVGRAFDRLPVLLVHNMENTRELLPRGFPQQPAGQLLRDRVHAGDAAFAIGHDDRIPNALEDSRGALFAFT